MEEKIELVGPVPAPAPTVDKDSGTKKRWRGIAHRFFKNKPAVVAGLVLAVILLSAIAAPWVAPHDPTVAVLKDRLKPPAWVDGGSPAHLLGTDQQGRDVLSRVIWGSRVSLRVGFIVVGIAGVFGIVMGLLAGYFGGRTDFLIMRLVDIQFSFPGLLIALVFVMVLGPGERNLIIALAFNGWMVHARMARGLVMTLRDGPMVEAAKSTGAGTSRILFRHLLPNILSPLLTLFVLEVARIIQAEASLSFLGYGIQPPRASWGLMIGEGRKYITNASWIVTYPGITIALTVWALNIISNWLRSEADPLQKGKRG